MPFLTLPNCYEGQGEAANLWRGRQMYSMYQKEDRRRGSKVKEASLHSVKVDMDGRQECSNVEHMGLTIEAWWKRK